MGDYGGEDEALVGLARQLADAYGEARTREDQDYACDAIAGFLSDYRSDAPVEALLALLDLPLTVETFPLVDETQMALGARGSAVVAPLLDAALGDVYDRGGVAPQRAVETLGSMDPHDVASGLVDLLCSGADERLKDAAEDALVGLGGVAEPDLVAALDDPAGDPWVRAALAQLRYAAEHRDEDDGGEAGTQTVGLP